MKRGAALLTGLLVATVAPCADRAADGSLDAVVEWFAVERGAQHDGTEARRILGQLERQLVRSGLDPSLARALATPPVAGIDDDPQGATGHALSRLRRFAESSARPDREARPDAEGVLEEILADPVFQSGAREATVLQRLIHRIGEWFRRLLGVAGRFAVENWILATVFLAALTAGIVALVVRQLLRWSRETHMPSADGSINMLDEPLPQMPDLIAAARRLAAQGHGLASLRLLVRASVSALRARALLPEEPGLTDLEGVRILRRTAPARLRERFRELAGYHDRGVYGGAGVGPEVVERAIELTEGIVRIEREATP